MKFKITDVERHGAYGWSWTATTIDPDFLSEPVKHRTDNRGEGLWAWSDVDQVWKQGAGHLQFEIVAETPAEAQRLIERFWREEERKHFGPE